MNKWFSEPPEYVQLINKCLWSRPYYRIIRDPTSVFVPAICNQWLWAGWLLGLTYYIVIYNLWRKHITLIKLFSTLGYKWLSSISDFTYPLCINAHSDLAYHPGQIVCKICEFCGLYSLCCTNNAVSWLHTTTSNHVYYSFLHLIDISHI